MVEAKEVLDDKVDEHKLDSHVIKKMDPKVMICNVSKDEDKEGVISAVIQKKITA